MWEENLRQTCIWGRQEVDCYQREWGSLNVSQESSFPESSDSISNTAGYCCRTGSLARCIQLQEQTASRQNRTGRESWNKHHKYIIFFHALLQKLHHWRMKEGSDQLKERNNEVRREENEHQNPTENRANVRYQVEALQKKVEIWYCFWFTKCDTLQSLLNIFSKAGKNSSMQIFCFQQQSFSA